MNEKSSLGIKIEDRKVEKLLPRRFGNEQQRLKCQNSGYWIRVTDKRSWRRPSRVVIIQFIYPWSHNREKKREYFPLVFLDCHRLLYSDKFLLPLEPQDHAFFFFFSFFFFGFTFNELKMQIAYKCTFLPIL